MDAGDTCPRTEGNIAGPEWAIKKSGEGPIVACCFGPDGARPFIEASDRDWFLMKIIFSAAPDYQGPLLIRGQQLDGDNPLYFASYDNQVVDFDSVTECANRACSKELRLPSGGGGFNMDSPDVRTWGGYTPVRVPGCYAYQIDGSTFSEVIVFQITPWKSEDLHPLPDWGQLPQDLHPQSAVHLDSDTVRLAFDSPDGLWARLDVGPAQGTPLDLGTKDGQRVDTTVGLMVWAAHPEYGWPQQAVWDDGEYRYHFSVLPTGVGPNAWSLDDLVTLVEAFAAAG